MFLEREVDACVWVGLAAGARRRRAAPAPRGAGHRAARRRAPRWRSVATGRAFVVSPSARRRHEDALRRCGGAPRRPGAAFGPSAGAHALEPRLTAPSTPASPPTAAASSSCRARDDARARGRVRRARAASAGRSRSRRRGARADFAASAVAPSGAAVVVWFRHRGAGAGAWRPRPRAPGRRAFGAAAAALGLRAAAVLHERVRRDRRARRRRRDVELDRARPPYGRRCAAPAARFRRRSAWPRDASDAPRAVVGAGGAAALVYSTQHVPLRASDGLQLHRAARRGRASGAAEHVNPGGGVTIAEAARHPRRPRAASPGATRCTARASTSPRPGQGEPLAGTAELGSRREREAHRAGGRRRRTRGRRLVAAGLTAPPCRERAVAALRAAHGRALRPPAVALGRPWRSRGARAWRGSCRAGRARGVERGALRAARRSAAPRCWSRALP